MRSVLRINSSLLIYCELVTIISNVFYCSNNFTMLIKKLQKYMRLKNYSHRTIKSYTSCARVIYSRFKKSLKEINKQEFENFLNTLITKNRSPYTINQYHATLKLVFEKIYKIPFNFNFDIPYAKRVHKLPVILSRKDINRILDVIKNPKHKLLIALSYGTGLRVSEAINLKVRDIDFEELTIHLKQTKGAKDRITIFPEKIRSNLKGLITGKKSDDYLFESERGGKLTERTAQKVFKNALRRAGIKKNATFHSLRHSFATHLLENGVDVRYIQKLLGHQNIRTTQRYTQVTNPQLKNIKSPLD